jgi:hypothetical protein
MFTNSKSRALSLLVLIMFLFVPIVGAVSNTGNIQDTNLYKAPKNHNTETDLFSELNAKVELYNQNFDQVPAIIKELVGSEEIAGKIKLENGKMLYVTVTTNEGKIESFSESDPNSKFEPSITVKTDEKTVREVLDSKDPFNKVIKCINEGTIKVKPKDFVQSTVLWTLEKLGN